MAGFAGLLATTRQAEGDVLDAMVELLRQTDADAALEPRAAGALRVAGIYKTRGAASAATRWAWYEDDAHAVFFDGDLLDPAPSEPARWIAESMPAERLATRLAGADGLFRCVVYEKATGRLHLFTDRYGLAYLYWHEAHGTIYFGTEAKAFLPLLGPEPEIDSSTADDALAYGHPTEQKSWLAGVEMLPAGGMLSFEPGRGIVMQRRYVAWEDVREVPVRSRKVMSREFAELFGQAVRRRMRPGERVGLMLSGGLDSRAIFAAMPGDAPIHAFTFGRPGCRDIRIAQWMAQKRPSVHHVAHMTADNWLTDRESGVWWTDGHCNMLHMQIVQASALVHPHIDVNLDGFMGGAFNAGRYAHHPVWSETQRAQQRGRRFINEGRRLTEVYLTSARAPFYDRDLIEWVLAIPTDYRADGRMYRRWLRHSYPDYYPPIVLSEDQVHAVRKLVPKWEHDDYGHWLRRDPARGWFERTTLREARYLHRFVSAGEVEAEWRRHLAGENRADVLGRYATVEIHLRQIFEPETRPPIRQLGAPA